ncbi:MAG TPA: peptidoglycan DD-metalloendopeptidase family protein, partial [Caulobacteraceae bacterium]|nr:peptidoglycan DD-metalloendopeptidase family protein [Caulobacteraceae bacterium]
APPAAAPPAAAPPAPTAYVPPRETPPPAARRVEGPRMAVTGRVVQPSGVYMDYEVSKGYHVDSLARQFGTTRKAIVEASKLKPPYGLRPGQIIKIPVSKAYVVQEGDTLALIARRFDVEVAELTELNHVGRRGLRPGEKIALPATFRDRGPIRLPGTQVAEAAPPRQTYRPPTYTPPAYTPPTPVPTRPAPPPEPPPRAVASNPPSFTPQPVPQRPPSTEAAPGLSDAEVARAATGRFIWPIRGDILSGFGPKGVGRRNDGLDIKAAQGTVVHAAAAGDVVYAGDQVPGFGNLVLVKHADGWVTAYAHLDKVSVAMRQQVTQGQEIGQVGVSGGVTEPQLHFEVRYAPTPADKAKPVDPQLVLPR